MIIHHIFVNYMNNVKKIKVEIREIIKALEDNESYFTICDSYEDYSKSMLDFIKSKDHIWFDKLFDVIEEEIEKGAHKESLIKELQCTRLHKNLMNHIVDVIFDEDIIENTDDDDDNNEYIENQDNLNDIPLEEAVKNFRWRKNQTEAINNTIAQNFKSGVHNQIMGSGKTYIIFKTIDEHYKMDPTNGLYVISCFRQEILKDMLFDKDGDVDGDKVEKLKSFGIIDLNEFNIIDRVHEKKKTIKLSKIKPSILIINTDYLRVICKIIDYSNINFVILDECHSVSAPKFHNILHKIKYDHQKHIIGFSATPLREKTEKNLVDIFSLTMNEDDNNKKLNIISNYDLITAIKDEIILPPYYILCEVNKTLNGKIGKDNKSIMERVLLNTLKTVPYKKVIGWCRTIEQMKIYYKYIKQRFPKLEIFCSSFRDDTLRKMGYSVDWYEFTKRKNNCILLCVNRFREGSDILNLDTAIYLDIVKNRSLLVALQTSGRVLRKDQDHRKTHGTIIDSFVNCDGIQIEVMTADRIIKYYKQIFMLCDDNDYQEQREAYNQMVDICKNMIYDEAKQEITVKIDEEQKHDMKFKLELKTRTYDFNKLKLQIGSIIDKMYNVDKKEKFNIIIDKIKKGKYMNINTKDFWKAYDEIPDDEKEEMNIPKTQLTAKDLYKEYREFFNDTNWYTILDLDTHRLYSTIEECRKALIRLKITNISEKIYHECTKKDKKLPVNPHEFFKISPTREIDKVFTIDKKVFDS